MSEYLTRCAFPLPELYPSTTSNWYPFPDDYARSGRPSFEKPAPESDFPYRFSLKSTQLKALAVWLQSDDEAKAPAYLTPVYDHRFGQEAMAKIYPLTSTDALFGFREARLLAHLAHPNIVTIYDATVATIEDQDVFIFFLEKIIPLKMDAEARILELNLGQRLTLLQHAGRALSFAHKKRITLGDVKPSNMGYELREGKLRGVVFDFSEARGDYSHLDIPLKGPLVSSPWYAAPEIWSQLHHLVDYKKFFTPEADQYALGVSAAQLLEPSVFDAIIGRQPKDPIHLPETLTPNKARLYSRVLAWEPEQRFPSVGAFTESLASLYSL